MNDGDSDPVATPRVDPHESPHWFELAEAMPLMVWAALRDGRVHYANSRFREYIGDVEMDDLSGDWVKLIHPEDRETLLATWTDAVRTGTPYTTQARIRRGDGEYRWHALTAQPNRDPDGRIRSWYGAALDRHDAIEGHVAIRHSERRLRAVFDSEPECVTVIDPDGTVLEINRAGLDLLQASNPDEVIGRLIHEFIHPEDLDGFISLHRRVAAGAQARQEFRCVGRRGTIRWVEQSAVPLDPVGPGSATVLAVARDITIHKERIAINAAETHLLSRLLAAQDLDEVLGAVAATLEDLTGAMAAILLCGEDCAAVQLAGTVSASTEYRAALHSGPLDDLDPARQASTRRETVVIEDLRAVPGTSPVRDALVAEGFVRSIATPVRCADGEVLAVLALHTRWPSEDASDHRALLERFAPIVRLAIERAETERELRDTNRMLSLATRLGRIGSWSVNLPGDQVVWSDEVAAIHDRPPGYQPDVDEGISYYAPDSQPVISEAFRLCVDEGVPYDVELELITATGRRIWCRSVGEAERDAEGRIVRVAGAFQDITATKQIELALRESEERYRILSEVTSDVVFDWDLVGGRVWYGDGLVDLIGADPRLEDLGSDLAVIRSFVVPEDRDRVVEELDSTFRSGELWASEFRIQRADGTVLDLAGHGMVVRGSDGRVKRMVGNLVDLTTQRTLERQLQRSQHLEAIGQLTGGIAHDFNNLLTVIIGNVDALTGELSGTRSEVREHAELTRDAAVRASELIQRLLAFARRQPLAPTVIDVAALVDRLDGLLRRSLGEDIEITVEHEPELWTALVDATQLESALLNLALNARDAMPGGGQLRIRTTNLRRSTATDELMGGHPAAGGGAEDLAEMVCIEMTDSGFGMEPDVLDRVIEPFYTTKPPGKGSGLGLSMVYGFVEQSSGLLELDSRPGAGTTVRILLPRASEDVTAQLPRPTAPPAAGGGERVLLVEDDDLVRSMAAAQLRKLGYTVVEAVDGPNALELLEADEPFDLLFTDVIMPGGLNGRELADRAQQRHPGLPVLFTSGYAEDAIVHDGRLDAGVELLTKPYRLEQLAARIRAVLDSRPT